MSTNYEILQEMDFAKAEKKEKSFFFGVVELTVRVI